MAQTIVGRAVRACVFVIDKTDELDAPVAPQVAASLDRLALALALAYADAFVFHDLPSMKRFEALAQPGGGFD